MTDFFLISLNIITIEDISLSHTFFPWIINRLVCLDKYVPSFCWHKDVSHSSVFKYILAFSNKLDIWIFYDTSKQTGVNLSVKKPIIYFTACKNTFNINVSDFKTLKGWFTQKQQFCDSSILMWRAKDDICRNVRKIRGLLKKFSFLKKKTQTGLKWHEG